MRRVVILVVVVFCLMGMIPPWAYTFSTRGMAQAVTSPAGYHVIFLPPQPKEDSPVFGVQIDWPRLLVQWAVLLAVFGGYLFLKGYAHARKQQH